MGRNHSMGKRRMISWIEQDAFTGWRHVMTYFTRAGRAKAVKQMANRRDRRATRRDLKRESE